MSKRESRDAAEAVRDRRAGGTQAVEIDLLRCQVRRQDRGEPHTRVFGAG